jgi:hypothetical protein
MEPPENPGRFNLDDDGAAQQDGELGPAGSVRFMTAPDAAILLSPSRARGKGGAMKQSIPRRTVLKGFGIAVATAALGTSRPQPTHAQSLPRETKRCYIYLEHAASNLEPQGRWTPRGQWVISALLVLDPRLPRQLLRRTKRHRLPAKQLRVPEIHARKATDDFREYLYKLLASRKDRGLEAYSIHVNQGLLRSQGDKVGLYQLRLIQALLKACDLGRFPEVLVYQNLPSLQGLSEKAFRNGLQGGPWLPKETRLRVWEHDPAWDQGPLPVGHPRILSDEGLQVAEFLVYAFFQKYQYRNGGLVKLVEPIVRREIDARGLQRSELR